MATNRSRLHQTRICLGTRRSMVDPGVDVVVDVVADVVADVVVVAVDNKHNCTLNSSFPAL